MHNPSNPGHVELQTTTSSLALPCELRIQILKELGSLQDLQAAILASRHLFSAYESSRSLVRQQVFRNRFLFNARRHVSAAGDGACSVCFGFVCARTSIVELEAKNQTDGRILRASLWDDLLDHVVSESSTGSGLSECTRSMKVFTEWSLALSAAYRRESQEEAARRTGTQTLGILKSTIVEYGTHGLDMQQTILEWLLSAMANCVAQGQHDICLAYFEGVWDHFASAESDSTIHKVREKPVFEMVKSLHWVCVAIGPENYTKAHEMEARAWHFIRRHVSQSHADGSFCWNCSSSVDSLISTSASLHPDLDVLVAYQKSIWQALPLRSPIFAHWSRYLIQTLQSKGEQLEGHMLVWQKLQETQGLGPIDPYDLEWARDAIMSLRRASNVQQSLAIQASVFPLLEHGTGQYFAWGRELSKAYARNDRNREAFAVAQEMCEGLNPASKFYTTWTREFLKLRNVLENDA